MTPELRNYETICLTKTTLSDEGLKTLVEKCKAIVEEQGEGQFAYTDDWGKAKIAYQIKKEGRAHWTYFRFTSKPNGINELKRTLSLNEDVLRQMTSRCSDDGADYDTLRKSMPKELVEKDKVRDWKDDRRGPRGRGGPRGGGPRRPYNRDASSSAAPSADASAGGDKAVSKETAAPKAAETTTEKKDA